MHHTKLFSRPFIVTLLTFWSAVAVLMFLNGLRYGHVEVALVRNLYLPVLGALFCLPVSMVLERFGPSWSTKKMLMAVAMAAAGATLISLVLNPLTLSLLGAGLDAFTPSAITNQLVIFFLLLLGWSGVFNALFVSSATFGVDADSQAGNSSVNKQKSVIELKERGEVVKVSSSAVLAVTANGDYVTYHTQDKTYLASGRLQQLSEELFADGFRRVHRSILVNQHHVSSVTELGRRLYEIKLSGGMSVKSSKTYLDTVKKMVPLKT